MSPFRHGLVGWRVVPVLVGIAFVLTRPPPLSAQPQLGLFSDAALTVAGDRPADPTVVRSREVTVDFAQLKTPDSRGDPTSLVLNLFADLSYSAVLDRIDSTAEGFVWVGHIPAVELSTVTLATENGVMYGSILTPDAMYVVRPAGDGAHTVVQIDQSRFPPEANPLPVAPTPPGAALGGPAAPRSTQPDSGSLIDVMVLYTPAAAAAAGGASGITALINSAISTTNTTYANSGIVQRLRVAYSGQVAYTETGGSTGIDQDLRNLTDGVGALNGVAVLRDTYRADLVTLLTNTPGTVYCGIAWMMTSVSTAFAPNGYSVVEQTCAVGNLSFPHELGHNMGAGHDWFVDGRLFPYSYSHGYVNPVARWRTVMAYNNLCANQGFNCSRLAYWSNPGLTFGGAAMGVPGGTNSSASCYANPSMPPAMLTIIARWNNTAVTVANFRQSGLKITSLTPNVTFPVVVGTPVIWRATATGGVGPYTFKFWLYNGSTWSVGQEWSAANTFPWTPALPGSSTIQVWARNAGSSNSYDAWLNAAAIVSIPSVLTVTSPVPSPSVAPAGSPVRWTATAAGGSGPYTYKFYIYNGSTWSVGQEWSLSSTWLSTPFTPGTFTLQVWARNAGSSATYDAWRASSPYVVTVPASLRVTGLTSNVAFPVSAGTPVTWSTYAAGGTGPYTYKFWAYNGSTWTVVADWTVASTWTWTPPAAGSYTFQVWVRNAGSGNAYDAWRGFGPYLVNAPDQLRVNSLTDRAFPVPTGTPVR